MQLVTTDTGSTLVMTCLDADNSPIALTGASVKLRWKSGATIVERDMTVTSAVNGVCEYQFAAGELTAPRMRFEAQITDAGGKIVSSCQLLDVQVREKLA